AFETDNTPSTDIVNTSSSEYPQLILLGRSAMNPISCLVLTVTSTSELYTLSLHDALPIWRRARFASSRNPSISIRWSARSTGFRSEEHTSELQSRGQRVCRPRLEKT